MAKQTSNKTRSSTKKTLGKKPETASKAGQTEITSPEAEAPETPTQTPSDAASAPKNQRKKDTGTEQSAVSDTSVSKPSPKSNAASKSRPLVEAKVAEEVEGSSETKTSTEARATPEVKSPPKTKVSIKAKDSAKTLVEPTADSAKPPVETAKRVDVPETKTTEAPEPASYTPPPILPVMPKTKTVATDSTSKSKESLGPSAANTKPGAPLATGNESFYQEPKTAFIMPLPETAQAASISLHVPGESSHQQAKSVTTVATPVISEPSTPEAEREPEPVSEMFSHGEPILYNEQPGPDYPHMFVVQITPELAPLAKVGGLADVVTGLSRELEMRGHSVEIILPKYDCMHYDHIWGLCKTYDDLWVPWYNGHVHCTVWFGFVHGRKCFFIEPHSQDNFFNRGTIYGFSDDVLRYAFFCRAALEFLWKAGKRPDVIHCHDWQTALVPVFLYEIYQNLGLWHPRVCFTIHNFKHQGVTGDFLLNATGLHRPDYYFHHDRLLDNRIPHALNLMKGGIVYSNFVTTVSPRYAGETKDGGQGFGLEPTLHTHHYKFGGVVNGIDYDVWNPEIDPHIAKPFTLETLDNKYANKQALRNRLLLADNEKPIIAFVGRLDPQKGLDLVRHALFYALNHRAQFVLLGSSPERDINSYFWELKRHLNDSPDCHIEVGFDEDLAHLIYAGADMMVVPSLFEPCGLTQLIAMKYGTIPIVREVGGLADTVFDKDHAHYKALHERNGYVFRDYNNEGLESALARAIDCYYQFPEHFRELMKNAMRYDYSWKYPGQHYLNIYDYIRNK